MKIIGSIMLLWITLFYMEESNSSFQKQKVVAPDRQEGASYGWTTELNNNFLIVGVPGYKLQRSDNVVPSAGKVYVYKNNALSNQWDFFQAMELNDAQKNDFFGEAISINGNFLFVSADGKERKFETSIFREGIVKVYQLKENSWKEVQELNAPNKTNNSGFGNEIESFGNHCLISCIDGKKVYLYTLENNTWHLTDSIRTDNQSITGASVGMYGDLVAVGNVDRKVDSKYGPMNNCGEVVLYKITKENKLDSILSIVPSRPSAGKKFGNQVKMYGNRLVVGCNVSEKAFGRPVFVYQIKDNQVRLEATLKCPDNLKGNWFGKDIDIYDNKIIVGAMGVDKNENEEVVPYEGSAYLYTLKDAWTFEEKLKAIHKSEWDKFAFSVGVYKDVIVVGNRFDNEDENEENYLKDAGSVISFRR